MRLTKVGWAAAVAAMFTAPLALSACTHGPSVAAVWHNGKGSDGKPFTVKVSPASGAVNQPVTTEIGTSTNGGKITNVSMTDPSGKTVPGSERPDGSSWVPGIQLTYGAAYHATVTATAPDGKKQTSTTSFTTMADPGDAITSTLYFQDGQTYGVGMPVALQFDQPIPDSSKAAVEKRLFVQSDPPQVGVWHWFGDDQVMYRPEKYWQTGTKVTVRAALGGLPISGGKYLDTDRTGVSTIGSKTVFQVDNAKKQMEVFQGDKLVKTFPVSLGEPNTPTSSGNMVLMSHEYTSLFSVPGEYTVDVMYAERFTWDGQYLHAAPWSVGNQGVDNVSHGCVNLSDNNAEWVYNNSHIGDPVSVSGTEVHVTPGDGWTVWDMSWPDYIKGSALPQQDLLNQAKAEAAPDHGGKTAPHVN
ncbi:Ig-like domain-containing protein [Rugosimonospora acidiphila]|uniref:Ig-like domain-containing protein n=1 Tax=Rugosimonospora acidiphila TaxID=556531 RepID=A0ABP9RP42_9ACTN